MAASPAADGSMRSKEGIVLGLGHGLPLGACFALLGIDGDGALVILAG